eukprot:210307-Rhodomonas_salina.3
MVKVSVPGKKLLFRFYGPPRPLPRLRNQSRCTRALVQSALKRRAIAFDFAIPGRTNWLYAVRF